MARDRRRPTRELTIEVLPGDWGEVAATMTRTHGERFAVLKMANAHTPGGGYVEGMIAQEENLFRRTNCHFSIGPEEYDAAHDRYWPELTDLLSARHGTVYLDTHRPRLCIRGPEDGSRPGLGYAWLPDEDVFAFYELRAAARDLRDGAPYDEDDMRRRITAHSTR